jgi:hypothetical protein
MAIGPMLLLFILIVTFKNNLINRSYWMGTLLILFLFSFYKDPMMVSMLGVLLGEGSVYSAKVVGFYFILTLPVLLIYLFFYGFEIDVKLHQKNKLQKPLLIVAVFLVTLVGINEVILYWF